MKATAMEELRLLLGARIKQIRAEQGYTQNEFATVAGLTQAYLSRVERGIANPQVGKVYQIAQALGVPLSKIFDFDIELIERKNPTAHEKLKILSEAVQHLPIDTAESLFDVLSAHIKRQRVD